MSQDRGEENGSQADQSTLTQEEQVVPKWLKIASGFCLIPMEWFFLRAPHQRAGSSLRISLWKPHRSRKPFCVQCFSRAGYRAASLEMGEVCRKAAAACFQWVRTILCPLVYYFYCFYLSIVCVHTQTQKYIIIVKFGPNMTSSLPPVKGFLSVCSLAEFADKGWNSDGSIGFSKVS